MRPSAIGNHPLLRLAHPRLVELEFVLGRAPVVEIVPLW